MRGGTKIFRNGTDFFSQMQKRGIEEGEVTVEVPVEEDDEEEEIDQIPYREASETMMQILLENSFSQYEFVQKGQEYSCPLCLNDPTLGEDNKRKKWKKDHLTVHMTSQVHSRFSEIKREAIQAAADHPRGKFECTIYKQVLSEDVETPEYRDIYGLSKHWEKSSATKIPGVPSNEDWSADAARRHEEIKLVMGFGELDFKGDLEHREVRKAEYSRKRNRVSEIS